MGCVPTAALISVSAGMFLAGLKHSHDPVHQLSVSSRKLHFLFQFHRKQEVPARFVPIQSSIHTCASHLSLNATSHNWSRRYCCFLEALRQKSELWADKNVVFHANEGLTHGEELHSTFLWRTFSFAWFTNLYLTNPDDLFLTFRQDDSKWSHAASIKHVF